MSAPATNRKVLLTGASGFIGRVLAGELAARGDHVRAAVRRELPGVAEQVTVGEIGAATRWEEALRDIDCVVHLAGRAHVMHETAADPLAVFREVNRDGTRQLAEQAARAGVRRLVFVSSIKVNGERSGERAFSAGDTPAPQDPYGVSKLEAELALREVAAASALEVVVVRPPLVYGAGVGGNFRRLIRLLERGVYLPFGRVSNRRSYVSVYNLADLLAHCIDSPAAAGRTLLVSDDEDLSTAALIERLARAMGRRPRLLPVPVPVLRALFGALGRRAEFDRLCGSLRVDVTATRSLLGWSPPLPVDEGLRRTVQR